MQELRAGQIVYLEKDDSRLYAEVIQTASSRQTCWVRPLVLVVKKEEEILTTDLRDTSDILWSLNSFHMALDTEVISALSFLATGEPKSHMISDAREKLHQFINNMWKSRNDG